MDAQTAERAERYRSLADTSRGMADRSEDPEMKATYEGLARGWMRLAERLKRETRTFSDDAPTEG